MHIVFIRHGESTGNIGLPCPDMSRVELTERGRRQARHLADTWTVTPTLIVVSPFLRTQQTAQPTRERFPAAPVEEWGIEEFTYLEPSRWNGSAYSDRLPSIEAYWKAADPNYCDGPGAETFATLLRRAEATLKRLQTLIGHLPTVFLFSHGQFMQAIRITVLYSEASDQEKMHLFLENNACPTFQNAELFQLYMAVGGASNAIFYARSFEKPDRPYEQGQQLEHGEAPDPAETFKDESSPNPLSKEQLERCLNNFLHQRFKIAETQGGITAFSEGMPRQKGLLDFQSSVNRAG